jgi:hypothetical protein
MANDTLLSQLLSTANPFAVIENSIKVDRLPTLSYDERMNKVLWNTIGTATATTAGVSLLTAIAHKVNKNKWEKKNRKIIKDKVNSVYPISAPNYAENLSSITDVRNLGLNSMNKDAAFDPSEGRGIFDYLKDISLDTVMGAVPVAGALTAAAATPAIINKVLKRAESKKLDRDIVERRNKLAALQAKYIELGLDTGLQKNNSAQDTSEGIGVWSVPLGVIGAGTTGLTAMALYKYMAKNDNHRKRMKLLEDIVAENSTNIPQEISLKLTSSGRPAKTRKDQKYIEDMEKAMKKSDKANDSEESEEDDFSDKLTNIKKDALFS